MAICCQPLSELRTPVHRTICHWLSIVSDNIPHSFNEKSGADYLPESKYCMLLNEAGHRFADETMGDEIVNQYLAKQERRRGFLLFK
jgi:hypothetical protein